MKISKFNLNNLRNEEHFEFQTEFKTLVEAQTPGALKVEVLYDPYRPLYHYELEALNLITKNSLTEALAAADHERDSTYRGLDDTVTGALNHFDDNVKVAAKRLRMLLDQYGNITIKAYPAETAAIVSLVSELRGAYASDAAAANMEGWVNQLEADNNDFVALSQTRFDDDALKTQQRMKNVRVDVDAAYNAVVERINALANVEGEANYADFIKKLNERIDKFSLILAQRKGRNAKAKAEEAAKSKTEA